MGSARLMVCQPRKAPAIISKSASPRPRASRFIPASNRILIPRPIANPAAAPINPVISPIIGVPGAAQLGHGPQNGHIAMPLGIDVLSDSSIHDLFAGSCRMSVVVFGNGHGKQTFRTTPSNVPKYVIGSGMILCLASMMAEANRPYSRAAWLKKYTHAFQCGRACKPM